MHLLLHSGYLPLHLEDLLLEFGELFPHCFVGSRGMETRKGMLNFGEVVGLFHGISIHLLGQFCFILLDWFLLFGFNILNLHGLFLFRDRSFALLFHLLAVLSLYLFYLNLLLLAADGRVAAYPRILPNQLVILLVLNLYWLLDCLFLLVELRFVFPD
jgi:hypothetical protein